MTSVKRNLAASFFGRGWSAVLQLVLVPIYLRLLGADAFALVGFYALLFSVVARLDLGLSTTLNRELARASAIVDRVDAVSLDSSIGRARDLLRTLEVVYFGVALLAGAVVWLAAPLIATRWLHGTVLGERSIAQAVALMGMVVAVQWPMSLYEGGLRGLERQALLNGIGALMSTLRGLGAVVILLWVSRTIAAYFIWQAIANALHVAVLAVVTWRAVPGEPTKDVPRRPRFRTAELSRIWRFTAALSGISILGLVLTQADKIVLSKMLSLDRFAYYNVAWSVAAGLLLVSVPLFEAIFPRLSALTAAGATDALRRTYHMSIQLSTVLAVPAAAVLLLFSPEVARVWLHDARAAAETHRLIGLLAVGTAANVVMTIPFALQLAAGWTRLSLYKNAIALVMAVPLLLFAVARYGAIGAAAVWIAINAGYLVFELPVMHRRLLPGSLSQVYLRDIGAPSVLALGGALAARVLATALALPALPSIMIAAVLALAGAIAASPLAVNFASVFGGRRASSVPVG
jgi:O-antigen/teichoic acid export membrane protein